MKPESRITTALMRCRAVFLAVLVFSFGVNILMLASPIYMMQVFDRVVPTGNTDTLLVLSGMAVMALIVLGMLDEVRGRMLIRVGDWVERAFSPEVVASGVRVASSTMQPSAQGLRDLATIRQFVGSPALLPLIDAPWVPVFLVIVYLIHPWLGHVALVGAAVLFVAALLNNKLTAARQARANVAAAMAFGRAESALRNADTITAMGMLPELIRQWGGVADEAVMAQSGVARTSAILMAASKAFRLALQVAVLGIGAYLVILQDITAGGMIASSIIMSRALAPVEQSLGSWRTFIAARVAFRRLSGLLAAGGLEREKTELPTPVGRITVEGAGYLPPGAERPILHNISFDLPAGSSLGIVGPSGSGKSTLARLLVGAVPPGLGKIRLDGADLADWREEQRGRYVGYLPQDVQLFDATVSDNISRLAEVEDERVVEAATRASAHEMILRLPRGYDAEVGDNGRALSGGQRQRIGLARALFGEPAVLVLDEPTASLDNDGELQVIEAIGEAKKRGVTVIVIDHKIKLIQNVDFVLMLRDGQAVSFGPRDQVLKPLLQPAQPPSRPRNQISVAATSGSARIVDTKGDGND